MAVDTGLVERNMGCKGTGREKDQLGVVEDEGNGGGSLVNEGSSEEEEGPGSGFVSDIGLGEVG